MRLVRTQTQLRPEQRRELRTEASRRGMSLSGLVREILEQGSIPPWRDPETIEVVVVRAGFPARYADGPGDPSARTAPRSSRQRYARRPPKKIDLERAWAFMGAGRSGASDVAEHHDDYLAGKRK